MERHANARRRAVSVAMKRKEEYLGARVPKELRDRVLARAKDQGIPVSILIRNVLLDAFPEGELNKLPGGNEREVQTDPDGSLLSVKFKDVLGWETLTLNRQVQCSHCGCDIGVGVRAVLGMGGVAPVILCGTCSENI